MYLSLRIYREIPFTQNYKTLYRFDHVDGKIVRKYCSNYNNMAKAI